MSPLLREENQRACKEREIALEDKRNNRSDSSDEESHEDDAERRLDRALLREAEAGASKDLNTAVGGDGRPTDPIVKAVLRSLELLDAGVELAAEALERVLDDVAHLEEGKSGEGRGSGFSDSEKILRIRASTPSSGARGVPCRRAPAARSAR